MAIKLLSVIIMNIGAALTQLDPSTLQMLMKGMSFLINGKRNNMKTSALDVCIFICNQIGSENYIQLSNYALNEQEVISMTQLMETHRIQKQKGPQLADYLKQYKTEVRQRQSGAWSQGIRWSFNAIIIGCIKWTSQCQRTRRNSSQCSRSSLTRSKYQCIQVGRNQPNANYPRVVARKAKRTFSRVIRERTESAGVDRELGKDLGRCTNNRYARK